MIEPPVEDTDYIGLLAALWSGGTALTSEAAAAIDALAGRLQAAERRMALMEKDRDYWRDQHDQTLIEWKADLDELSRQRSGAPSGGGMDMSRAALAALLRFFDPRTGAVSGRNGRDLLCDAFAQAAEVCGRASET